MGKVAKVIVGQVVFVKPLSNAARRSKEIVQATVTSVGNKYFTLSSEYYRNGFPHRFFLDTMFEDNGNYSPDYQAYLSEKDIADEIRRPELNKEILNMLAVYSVDHLEALLVTLKSGNINSIIK